MEQDYEIFVESLLIVRDIVKSIVKGAQKIVAEKHILTQLPQIGYDWFQEQITFILEEIENDSFEDALFTDEEPTPVVIENWRRFQGQFFFIKSRSPSPLKRSETKKLTKISLAQTQRKSDIYETQLVQTGELDDNADFDPNIESIRQAKLRQISIQQQKQINDKVKIQEVQEQARQLKRLNVDSKSKYTYDFEGKVVIQKAPDMDRYPKSHQSVYEKRTLVEVRDLLPNRKLQQELIPSGKKQSLLVTQANQFTNKTSVPQIDLIVVKEGVTFFDGKTEKKKERQLPLMEIKDASILQTKLHDSSVHMTKSEYQVVTNTQQINNFQNKTLQLSVSEQQLPQPKTTRTFQEDKYLNGDSLLSYRQPKTINQSISTSTLQKLNGSISILSEQQLEELLVTQNTQGNQLLVKNTNEKKLQSVQPIKIELPQIPPYAISNSVSKLPKIYSISGAFPKLLVKYPRERVTKKVFNIKTNL